MKKQENKRGEAGERPWLRATLAALRGGLLACGAAVLLLLAASAASSAMPASGGSLMESILNTLFKVPFRCV